MACIEFFHPITDHEKYFISTYGRVYSSKTSRYLKAHMDTSGYLAVILCENGETTCSRLHRLVAECFLNNLRPDRTYVNHKDANKLNNNIDNLEWVTQAENMAHHRTISNNKNGSSRAVIRMNDKGEHLETYPTMTEALKHFDQKKTQNYNKLKTAASTNGSREFLGFYWKFEKTKVCDEEISIADMKPIDNYPEYLIGKDGKIYSQKRKIFMKPNGNRYRSITLSNSEGHKAFTIHRLVAIAYIPKISEDKCVVNHKDGDTHNNHVDNLEWVTQAENMLHAHRSRRKASSRTIYADQTILSGQLSLL